VIRLVTVGPLPIYFGNVNVAMGLRGHHHTAQVHLVYGHRHGEHGYPSFQATNDELRAHLSAHTGPRNTFRDATNEDVAERLFNLMCEFTPPSAYQYGGAYWLDALHLDVEGVQDDIGHDNGVTRYTIARPPLPPPHRAGHAWLPYTVCGQGHRITSLPITPTTPMWPCGCPQTNPGTPVGGH
jgi:hypothetical protein